MFSDKVKVDFIIIIYFFIFPGQVFTPYQKFKNSFTFIIYLVISWTSRMKVILLLWPLLAFILVVKGHEGHDHVHEGKNPTVPMFMYNKYSYQF